MDKKTYWHQTCKPDRDPDKENRTSSQTDGRLHVSVCLFIFSSLSHAAEGSAVLLSWGRRKSMEAVRGHMMLPLQFTRTERERDWWWGHGGTKSPATYHNKISLARLGIKPATPQSQAPVFWWSVSMGHIFDQLSHHKVTQTWNASVSCIAILS